MKALVKGAWVVVADEDKALILRNTGDVAQPVLEVAERIDTKDLLAVEDRSARLKDHKQHETVEPPDYHRMAGATLAGDVVAHLRKAHTAGQIEALVLVAPPQVLGALRDALDGLLAAEILAEFPKTLTGHPVAKIAEIVAGDLAEL